MLRIHPIAARPSPALNIVRRLSGTTLHDGPISASPQPGAFALTGETSRIETPANPHSRQISRRTDEHVFHASLAESPQQSADLVCAAQHLSAGFDVKDSHEAIIAFNEMIGQTQRQGDEGLRKAPCITADVSRTGTASTRTLTARCGASSLQTADKVEARAKLDKILADQAKRNLRTDVIAKALTDTGDGRPHIAQTQQYVRVSDDTMDQTLAKLGYQGERGKPMTNTTWNITEKQSGITVKTDCPQCAELIIENNEISAICDDCAKPQGYYIVPKKSGGMGDTGGTLFSALIGAIAGFTIDSE